MGAAQSTVDATLASCRQLVDPLASCRLGTGDDDDDEQTPQAQADPAAPQRLSLALRRKLGRGATYNLKVLVRGDMSTGKSSLVRRLQGLPFQADLPPTREITTGHVDWSAPDCEDTVKVEVWDVCDTAVSEQSKRRSAVPGTPRGLSLEHGRGALDADNIDVFRGAHAVVYVFDPRKRWTLDYVQRQLPSVPPQVSVLILGGFADLLTTDAEGAEPADVVPVEEVQRMAEAEAARRGRPVLSARASMLDCYGLDVLYNFLQLPYCLAKEQGLARSQEELTARQARAEEGLRADVAAQEYESHRYKLMQLRDGHHGHHGSHGSRGAAQSQSQHQAQPTPRQPTPTPVPTPTTQAAAPPSAGLCSTPYPAPSQAGTPVPNGSGAAPSLISPPRLAPPPGSGAVQLQVTPRTAPVAAAPPPRGGSLGGSLSMPPAAGMDASIDDSFFGDDDEPGYPASASAGSAATRGPSGGLGDAAVMGLLALDEPE
jgi:hypothetical protein